jgi:mRNA interferase MazF
MEQGEVWWARLDGEAGTRPAVILTRSWIIPRLTHVTVAQLTRSVRNIPTHVKLSRVDDGVLNDCAANLDNIQTIPKDRLFEKIVRLRHERMEEIFAAIRAAFDMPR